MAAAPAEVIRPLRRVEYDQLVALGVFQDERIELLDGALYEMSPIGILHNFAVQELNEQLVLALHGRAKVRPQMSFAASELSVPEYWIVNLSERCIEVYTVPEGNAYACVEKYGPGQAIRLGAFNDVEVR